MVFRSIATGLAVRRSNWRLSRNFRSPCFRGSGRNWPRFRPSWRGASRPTPNTPSISIARPRTSPATAATNRQRYRPTSTMRAFPACPTRSRHKFTAVRPDEPGPGRTDRGRDPGGAGASRRPREARGAQSARDGTVMRSSLLPLAGEGGRRRPNEGLEVRRVILTRLSLTMDATISLILAIRSPSIRVACGAPLIPRFALPSLEGRRDAPSAARGRGRVRAAVNPRQSRRPVADQLAENRRAALRSFLFHVKQGTAWRSTSTCSLAGGRHQSHRRSDLRLGLDPPHRRFGPAPRARARSQALGRHGFRAPAFPAW